MTLSVLCMARRHGDGYGVFMRPAGSLAWIRKTMGMAGGTLTRPPSPQHATSSDTTAAARAPTRSERLGPQGGSVHTNGTDTAASPKPAERGTAGGQVVVFGFPAAELAAGTGAWRSWPWGNITTMVVIKAPPPGAGTHVHDCGGQPAVALPWSWPCFRAVLRCTCQCVATCQGAAGSRV